jgi:hypothetical protein
MMPSLIDLVSRAASHAGFTIAAGAAVVAATWALHIWRLRGRERDLLMLVDERTRQWQDEAHAHAQLRAQVMSLCGSREPDGTPTLDAEAPRGLVVDVLSEAGPLARRPEPRARVLVVDDKPETREAIASLLDGLGITPVFADSPWAATVAANQAALEDAPYDLILVGSSMEGIKGGRTSLYEHVDAAEIARLLVSSGSDARPESDHPGLAG